MNTRRWMIGLTGVLAMGAAGAQCPTDEQSRFIHLLPETFEEKILFEQELKVRINEHDFDTVQVGVNDETPKVFPKTVLQDLPGTDTGLDLRIGPRKSAAQVIIGESERILWVKTLRGGVCKSETRQKLFGGDSRVAAVVVGINDYAFVRDLSYAEKDAGSFEVLLRSTIPADDLNLVALYGEDASFREISKAIFRAAASASQFGTVLVYFSGHGTLEKVNTPQQVAAYFVPQDAHVDLPHELIDHVWIVDQLSSSTAAQKVLISDSCFSGTSLTRPVQSTAGQVGTSKSLMNINNGTLKNTAARIPWIKLPSNLLWFSSSAGTEVSYESETLKGGLFTHYLLASLAPEGRTYIQAKDFIAAKMVGEQNGVQTPGLTGDSEFQRMHFPLTVRGDAP